MPETPTNAGNRYVFLVACYSNFDVSRLSTLWHCGSDPVAVVEGVECCRLGNAWAGN